MTHHLVQLLIAFVFTLIFSVLIWPVTGLLAKHSTQNLLFMNTVRVLLDTLTLLTFMTVVGAYARPSIEMQPLSFTRPDVMNLLAIFVFTGLDGFIRATLLHRKGLLVSKS
jgi:hypothetical protein